MNTAERELRLSALRTPPTSVPDVLTPARLARPGEVPDAASLLLRAVVEPWRARVLYACGPAPYGWSIPGARSDDGKDQPGTRASGYYRLAAAVLVQLRHPDGRAAVAMWTSDSVTSKAGAKLPKGELGPRRPPEWGQAYGFDVAYRWRTCTCSARGGAEHPAAIPVPIGAVDLRRAVSLPYYVRPPVPSEAAA